MQINFDHPLEVSKNFKDKDHLKLEFYENFYFFDTDGLFINGNSILKKVLPSMMKGGNGESLL